MHKNWIYYLFELYAVLLFVFFYPVLILIVMIHLLVYHQIGVLMWLVVASFLTPPTALWYFVMKKRAQNYLKLLLSKPKPWDVKKIAEEYIELLKKQKK